MTLAQVKYAEQRMQQQWHDLVMAEQAGQPLEALEQIYNIYILMAEAFNSCMEEYQRQRQSRWVNSSAWHPNNSTRPVRPCQAKQQDAKLAS